MQEQTDKSFTLDSVYSGFLAEREKYRLKNWASFSSFLQRNFGFRGGYISLLANENEFNDKLYDWVAGHFNSNKCTLNDVKDARINLKSYREELSYRNVFLIIFIPLLFLSVAIGKFIEGSEITLIVVNGLFSIGIMVERIGIAKHMARCSQLDFMLEKLVCERRKDINDKPNE